MGIEPDHSDSRTSHVDALIAEYLSRVDQGASVAPAQFMAEHPQYADQLKQYFSDVSMVNKIPTGSEPELDQTMTSLGGETENEDTTNANTQVRGTVDSETSVTQLHQEYDSSGSHTAISIPEVFGRYKIRQVLGQGAMGAVYLAHDTQLDRDVALKIPKFGDMSKVDEQEVLARFYREARAAATLRSPNICPVYDVGEIDGQHYITMAYIDGRPLKDFTKSKKKHSEKQIATTIRKLALGLQEAHDLGVVHRDLKPANIMVDKKAEPVVMDFGLARNSSEDVQVTQSGAIVGTPAYMSPEQVTGEQELIGPHVDIYALGVIMYELITGSMPFKGNLMSILQQIALNNPEKPSEIRPDIDPRLENICLKMMAGDISQRYQSMTDVANDLQECLRTPANRGKESKAKKFPSKPTRIPTADEESNPALISIEQPKSYAEQLRSRKSKSSSKTHSSDLITPQRLMITGGLGGLILLLGLFFLFRTPKYNVEVTLADPSIKLSVDGDPLHIDNGHEVKRLTAGRHIMSLEAGPFNAEVDNFFVTKDGKSSLVAKIVNNDLEVTLNGKKIHTPETVVSEPRTPPSNVKLSRGLVGHWGFEDASGSRVLDSSGKLNHGRLEGEYTWQLDPDPSPITGKRALRIQKGKMVVPVSPSLALSNEMAFAFWCKLDETGSGRRFFVKNEILNIETIFRRIIFAYQLESSKEIIKQDSGETKIEQLYEGEWNHVVVNCTGDTSEIWFNGRLQATDPTEGQFEELVSPLIFGQNIHGSMDDLRIYNRALNRDEIRELANLKDSPEPLLAEQSNILKAFEFGAHEEPYTSNEESSAHSVRSGLQGLKPVSSHELEFKREDYVKVPSLKLDSSKPVTIELFLTWDWVESNPIFAGVADGFRLGQQSLNHAAFRALPNNNHGPRAGGGIIDAPRTRFHLAGVFTGEEMICFRDGKLIERVPTKGFRLTNMLEPFQIGGDFTGRIGPVRVSNIVRYTEDFDPAQMLKADEHTLALYLFKEGQGDFLMDSSKNEHHGTIHGAKWIESENDEADTMPVTPEWINLLPLINPYKDTDGDGGKFENDDFVIGHRSNLYLPVIPRGDYEIRAEFTTWAGPKYLFFHFPIKDREPIIVLASHDNEAGYLGAGLQAIDGMNIDNEKNPTRKTEKFLIKDQKQKFLCSVSSADDQVTIQSSIDGKTLMNWSGSADRLSKPEAGATPQLKFWSYKGMLTLHSLEIRMLSGELKQIRP